MFWKCQDDIKYSEITQGLKPSLRYQWKSQERNTWDSFSLRLIVKKYN